MIQKFGLIVERCVPETVYIRATGLVEKTLTVRCINTEGIVIRVAKVEPSTIKMYVPSGWEGDALVADVQLNPNERNQDGKSSISKTPFVVIDGRQKIADISVQVSLPNQERGLKLQTMESPIFCLVVNLLVNKNFEVKLLNEQTAFRSFQYHATEEAKRAYENMPYHVELVIEEAEPGRPYSKALQYRFPPEYVEKGEIEGVAGSLPIIDYELIPRTEEP
jgi:hypothetical protein